MTPMAPLLIAFCVLCYTGQNFFNKMFSVSYTGPESAATPVFASIYGLIVGLVTLVYNGFGFHADSMTMILGCVNGLVLFLFNLSAINAARRGPYSFQSLTMLFGSIIMALLVSVIFWGDRLTAVKIIGIVVMLCAFVLFNLNGLSFSDVKKGYFFWIALLFTVNGIYGVIMDAQQRLAMQTMRNEMIIVTFLSSAVISLVYLLCVQGRKSLAAFRMERRTALYSLGSSVCAAAAVNALMVCLAFVPVSILYSVENGCIVVLSALLSVIVLREKMTKNMVAGIIVAVISLIMLSV